MFWQEFPFHNGSIETLFSLSIIRNIKYLRNHFYLYFLFPSFLTFCIAIHYGAIEPGLLASGFRSLLRFPFHNGSIETKQRKKRYIFSSSYFHSTMVRLRHEQIYWESGGMMVQRHFHSTMVRLRHDDGMMFQEDSDLFPFHYGSMETLFSHYYFSLFLSSIYKL